MQISNRPQLRLKTIKSPAFDHQIGILEDLTDKRDPSTGSHDRRPAIPANEWADRRSGGQKNSPKSPRKSVPTESEREASGTDLDKAGDTTVSIYL